MRHLSFLILLATLSTLLVSASCSTSPDALQDRMDRRNESYSNFNERRKIRLQARQERTDMWFDRVMGN